MQFINYNFRNYNMKMQRFIALKCINTQRFSTIASYTLEDFDESVKRLWEEFLVTDQPLKGRAAEHGH